MGRDLKGKQLGTGISQRKDGLYTARFTTKGGQRKQKYFKKLQECRNWLAEAQYQDEHGTIQALGDMTVDAWFDYWINTIKENSIRYHTRRNHNTRYRYNIKPVLGKMMLQDVKPVHCQEVLSRMANQYANSTVKLTRITMHGMFDAAVEYEILEKNPVKKSVKCEDGKASKDSRVMTREEQIRFLAAAKGTSNYNQYALMLQTGLRIGELTGLQWEDIDFTGRVLHVKRTMDYVKREWKTGKPKSKAGNRVIPLTPEAIAILQNQKQKTLSNKVVALEFVNFVFINRNGQPTKRSTYNHDLNRLSRKAGIDLIHLHTLRHTFATRCVEAEMKPKTLQGIMGHSDIATTMNLYVHVLEDESKKEVEKIAGLLSVV